MASKAGWCQSFVTLIHVPFFNEPPETFGKITEYTFSSS